MNLTKLRYREKNVISKKRQYDNLLKGLKIKVFK